MRRAWIVLFAVVASFVSGCSVEASELFAGDRATREALKFLQEIDEIAWIASSGQDGRIETFIGFEPMPDPETVRKICNAAALRANRATSVDAMVFAIDAAQVPTAPAQGDDPRRGAVYVATYHQGEIDRDRSGFLR